ncbi:MAG: hypothetical protein K5685_11125 [Bacteroidales bacterium]|nr:hypothetical protein [Bacteroidales bacterium]
MKKVIFPILAGAFLFLNSCSTSKYMEARSISVNDAEIFSKPLVASLSVGERKTWTVAIKRRDAMAMGLNVNNMRAYALAVACKDGNIDSQPIYDAIVGATYVIKSSGKRYELEVTGFPAVYKSFKEIEHDDLELLKFSGQGQSELVPVNAEEIPKFSIFKK